MKTIFTAICTLFCIVILAACTGSVANEQTGNSELNAKNAQSAKASVDQAAAEPGSAVSESQISEQDAKKIALDNAGFAESDVSFIRTKLDFDDGRAVYDIEFYKDNVEYDYEVDAYTGDIRSLDYDIESHKSAVPGKDSSEYIGEAAAKAAALKHAGIAEADVNTIKIKLDFDDGLAVYEVDFYSGEMEYDYEINAADGTIMEYDVESIYD